MEEKEFCVKCGKLLPKDKILPSGLCPRCSQYLICLFSSKSELAIVKIHEIQSAEENTPCFNTGKKDGCGQDRCEWQDICDRSVAKDAV